MTNGIVNCVTCSKSPFTTKPLYVRSLLTRNTKTIVFLYRKSIIIYFLVLDNCAKCDITCAVIYTRNVLNKNLE